MLKQKKEVSVEEEPVQKKKKVMKSKKETVRKGKGKKKKTEMEWIDIEETDEEEEEELKKNEKETSEEIDTATDGSEKKDSYNDWDLEITMEEYLRKKKGKSPVIGQIDPSIQSTTKSPTITTPPSTSTTPPPPNKPDVIQKEKETEKLPTKEPTPPIEQPRENTPPIQQETPIISPNIAVKSGVLQVNDDIPSAEMETTNEGDKPAEKASASETSPTALDASTPKQQPVVTKVVESNLEETLNLVVTELTDKMRMEIGKKFLGAASKENDGGESVKVVVAMEEPKEAIAATTGEDPKERGDEEASNVEVDETLKDVAELLKDLPDKVLEETTKITKETEIQSSATTPGASTPTIVKSSKTAALKTDDSASKSSSKGEKKQPKPRPTPNKAEQQG